ncbi:autotransporter outer membrane beta-barrel domain-containing protein [Achromobacter deleyi]|uniref:autotransporter outer membrane beta-barrel domain-containing protein n=1 Tax=Achromobacter deleyi TaxID=1353891 RepID=UPI001490B396|nr:autotransporter outer membrane beta-barrel domain-containing protein [Achromobacter deleyi]QVQ28403.1 autotransporter outer membrane beta-barrel domain-containing protein [Achromobacter deleyi]
MDGENAGKVNDKLTGGGGGGGAAPGGDGGKGGEATGGPPGGAGGTSTGGYGIHVVGANTQIINAGRIRPGGGKEVEVNITKQQAVAIMYEATANNSVLRLRAGSDIVGAVDARRSTNNKLVLEGPATTDPVTGARIAFDVSKLGAIGTNVATTDLYQGFSSFEKTSEGTWELANTPTQASTPWTIRGGTLAIRSDQSLGSVGNALNLDGGTLQVLDNAAIFRNMTVRSAGGVQIDEGAQTTLHGVVEGSGGVFRKTGAGLLVVAGDGNYQGVTVVDEGTLQIGDGGTNGTIGPGAFVTNSALAFKRADAVAIGNAISGTGDVLQEGPGQTTLTGLLTYTGETYLNGGSLVIDGTTLGSTSTAVAAVIGRSRNASLELRNAELNGWVSSDASMGVDPSSRWNVLTDARNPAAGNNLSTVGDLTLAGRIDFAAPDTAAGQGVGRSVTANSLAGQNGTVKLYTVPKYDGVSDYIILNNGATGTTGLSLQMEPAKGGDPLKGDGLLVVQAGSATDNAFVQEIETPLSNRRGAYVYLLQHGGRVVGGVRQNPNNWYLRSEARPEVSIYSQLGNQASRYGELSVGTLNDRMGATEVLARKVYPFAWARTLTEFGRNRGSGMGLADEDIATKTKLGDIQLGSDVYVDFKGLSRRSAGVFASAATMATDVDHYSESTRQSSFAGRSRQLAYSLGGYYTVLDGKGGYLDLVTQASRYSVKTNAATADLELNTSGWGGLASAEIGKSFAIGEDTSNLRVEPQAQLIYQRIKYSASSDAVSSVDLPGVNSLTGRLGLRFSKTWESEAAKASTAWATVNLLATAGNSSSVYPTQTQGDVSFDNKLAGPRVGLKVGYDWFAKKNTFVNLQSGMEQGIGSRKASSYNINAGIKVLF